MTAVRTPDRPRLKVPFPFNALRLLITTRERLFENHIAETLLPIGRSLQREVEAPDYFTSLRVVLGVTAAAVVMQRCDTTTMQWHLDKITGGSTRFAWRRFARSSVFARHRQV